MKKSYYLFFIFSFFVFYNVVNAFAGSTTASNTIHFYEGGGCTYSGNDPCCTLPTVSVGAVSEFVFDLYDLNGNKLFIGDSSFNVPSNISFAAGTAVIFAVYETATVYPPQAHYSTPAYVPDSMSYSEADSICKSQFAIKWEEVPDDQPVTVNLGVHNITFYDDDMKPIEISSTPRSLSLSEGSSASVSYSISKTCLDRKTGKVDYKTGNSEACSSDEIDVNELLGVKNRTVYFIPLNIKSSDSFGIKVSTDDDADAFTSWTFSGTNKWNIKIPIKQTFYHEVKGDDKKIEFNGFEFYTRQINPKNPFPSGIGKCSYWDKKEEGDYIDVANSSLSESFSSKTYSTSVLSKSTIKEIRDYNSNHKYTDWSNMSLDGRSDFINNGIIKSENGSTPYKLGCGPSLKKLDSYSEFCD